jgi:hypothetical protein
VTSNWRLSTAIAIGSSEAAAMRQDAASTS